jgi:hypothetical protein
MYSLIVEPRLGKAKPVMSAPALAELHEIFLGQGGGALELVAGKHYRCDTANAELRKDGSLAYKITPISLVPYVAQPVVNESKVPIERGSAQRVAFPTDNRSLPSVFRLSRSSWACAA